MSQTDPADYLKAMADPASPTFESDFLDFKAKPDRDPKDKNLKEIKQSFEICLMDLNNH